MRQQTVHTQSSTYIWTQPQSGVNRALAWHLQLRSLRRVNGAAQRGRPPLSQLHVPLRDTGHQPALGPKGPLRRCRALRRPSQRGTAPGELDSSVVQETKKKGARG